MALLLLALGLSAGGAAAVLCPSANHGGAFIGMASDTSSYTVTPAQDGRDDVWTLVDEAKDNATSGILDEWTDLAEQRAWFLFEAAREG